MKNPINLKEIITSRGLDVNDLSKQLFPKNNHPRLALNRVIAGESSLNELQIKMLSTITGIPEGELFTECNWKGECKENLHIFRKGEFLAELDMDSNTTKIFKNGELIHEEIIHSKAIVLSEYVEKLNLVISNK